MTVGLVMLARNHVGSVICQKSSRDPFVLLNRLCSSEIKDVTYCKPRPIFMLYGSTDSPAKALQMW